MELLLIAIIVLVCFFYLTVIGLKRLNRNANSIDILIGSLYIFSIILFTIGMIIHSNPYDTAINPVDMECYSPFSHNDILTLIFYYLAFNVSILLVWIRKNILPPLTLTISLVFISIGIIISLAILFQISVHNTETLYKYNSGEEQILFLFAPLFSILIGVILIFQVVTKTINETKERTYSNKYINSINTFLASKIRKPIWIVILMFPVFFIATLILILIGQDANSIIKVFTDTATWKFSQQIHPPVLDHTGHYLCTVAALGSPKIVKPIRIGQRNGKPIIVNRQLLIANAFEELIQDISPRIHGIIRKNYDKYGYNLSKKINTTYYSDLTYILMKPLEWMFLIFLYLFSINPERRINKQYAE